MTDQIPADKVRKIVNDMRSHADHDAVRGREEEYVRHFADLLDALLPPRPTLADMTPEERAACQWMQADAANRRLRYVIANPFDDENEAALIDPDGDICWLSPDLVTPRPDLPRLEWPGDKKPAPAPALPEGWRLADHEDHGRVIVTTPEPGGGGKVAFVRQDDFWDRKYSGDWCKPDELTYIDTEPEADQ